MREVCRYSHVKTFILPRMDLELRKEVCTIPSENLLHMAKNVISQRVCTCRRKVNQDESDKPVQSATKSSEEYIAKKLSEFKLAEPGESYFRSQGSIVSKRSSVVNSLKHC